MDGFAISRVVQLLSILLACVDIGHSAPLLRRTPTGHDVQVLILGGGVSGIIAARSLHQKGIQNFLIVEAREELGGRMRSFTFGAPGRQVTLEIGCNWIQGTQLDDGPINPIFDLARKHNLSATPTDGHESMTTFDDGGSVDYLDIFYKAGDAYINGTIAAGARVNKTLVDTTARTGSSLVGWKPMTPHEMASEYYHFDWEYAQTPEQSSWIASSWGNNYTYEVTQGGFSDSNLMSIDQRGFKHIIQAEAAEFLTDEQVMLNATVKSIKYSKIGASVTLVDGTTMTADYVISTFSLGVLQQDDVVFEPALPEWKVEAIQSMTMGTYTKIFLQFPEKFWFDTQFALYADKERGRYPIWQGMDLEGFFPGSGVIFVTVTGDYSERIEALEDDQVQDEVMGVLRSMYPNVTIPDPVAFHFNRWHTDPLYRGSYSNWPPSLFVDHHTNLRATVEERLWFTGEATSQKYFGFLHGAYYEGEATGDTVAKCIQDQGCAGRPHVEEIKNARPYGLKP
ncbi:amine oxidase [Artomyces pyxidatus]|uniref:Amine oxidase n=1 Tax=Artomyces pyxidatus TaxID=48021 RepID=A0ACB8T2U8_9AGAM|nr:amine oxidase [Artomyces pyxidatus]